MFWPQLQPTKFRVPSQQIKILNGEDCCCNCTHTPYLPGLAPQLPLHLHALYMQPARVIPCVGCPLGFISFTLHACLQDVIVLLPVNRHLAVRMADGWLSARLPAFYSGATLRQTLQERFHWERTCFQPTVICRTLKAVIMQLHIAPDGRRTFCIAIPYNACNVFRNPASISSKKGRSWFKISHLAVPIRLHLLDHAVAYHPS